MKRIIPIIVFLLLACSENPQRPNPDVVAWEGYATEDPELSAIYYEMLDCVWDEAINFDIPYVYLVVEPVPYGSEIVDGYFIIGKFVVINMNCKVPPPNLDHDRFVFTVRHEFIHYILNQGNGIHDLPIVKQCQSISHG